MTLILLFLVSGGFGSTQVKWIQVNPQNISCVHVANYKIMYKCWYMPLGAMPWSLFSGRKRCFCRDYISLPSEYLNILCYSFDKFSWPCSFINKIREVEHLCSHLWLKSNFSPPPAFAQVILFYCTFLWHYLQC